MRASTVAAYVFGGLSLTYGVEAVVFFLSGALVALWVLAEEVSP